MTGLYGIMFYTLFQYISTYNISIALCSGIMWGIGMIFMTLAFNYVGIGLVFTISISIACVIGSIIPSLIHYDLIDLIYTFYGRCMFFGLLLFILSVCVSCMASVCRANEEKSASISTYSTKGVCFAIIGGLGSAFQGAGYIVTNHIIIKKPVIEALPIYIGSNIMWVIIFLGASVPYVLYFSYQTVKNNSFAKSAGFMCDIKNYIVLLCMGLLFFICLVVYSYGSNMNHGIPPTIGWIIFMSSIVLTANIGGIYQQEWVNCSRRSRYLHYTSICLVIIAIAVLSISHTMGVPN
jgi:L-rhamnose-H+ transport protein